MSENPIEFKLCPDCGSIDYIENYPTPGASICETCGHEITTIALKEISEEIEERFFAKRKCSKCGTQNLAEKPLFDDLASFRVVVFKCKSCGKLDGYRIVPSTWADSEEINDGDFDGMSAVIAKTEGQFLFSASAAEKITKALKDKERDPMELCKKRFQRLIEEKSPKMFEMGMAELTIKIATWKANSYLNINGPITNKQLEHLLSAAIALTQENLADKGLLRGKKLTERQLAEIFSARNTTRKWKALLEKQGS
jgi:transcription initiation factor TFIIIB Brf1 subunit/transcription initiation factor TFIIB